MQCKGDDSGTCCGTCHLKIVAVMASHERPEITRKAVKALTSQGCEVVLVVSNSRDLDLLQDLNPRLYPNNPLGSKWQFAVNEARELSPDLLVTCGSDDILNQDYIKNAFKFIAKGYDFVGVSQWYMEDTRKGDIWKAWYLHVPDFPVGSGRVYTKRILDSIGWRIFDVKASRKLDDKGFFAMGRNAMKYISRDVDADGLMITAVKGNWTMLNPIQDILKAKTIGLKKMDI